MTESQRRRIDYELYARRQAAQQAPLSGLFGRQQVQCGNPFNHGFVPQAQQQAPVNRPRKKVESKVVEPRMLNA